MYEYSDKNGRELPIASGCACGYEGWSNYETYAMHEWLLLEIYTQQQNPGVKYPEWLTKLAQQTDMLESVKISTLQEKFANQPANVLGLYRDYIKACLNRVSWREILKAVRSV